MPETYTLQKLPRQTEVGGWLVTTRVLALMKNINDNVLALMFKMVNE